MHRESRVAQALPVLSIAGRRLSLRWQANAASVDQTGIKCLEPPESDGRRAFEKKVAVLRPSNRT
jgi:hypothetical protein